MKKFVGFLLLIIIFSGLYVGYRIIRRNNLLNSGEDILLVNKFEGIYINSNRFPRDAITWKFKAVGYLDKMSEQKINKSTEGKEFIFLDLDASTYPQIDQQDKDAINDLSNALAVISQEQAAMCKKIEQPDVYRDCLMHHYILKLISTSQDNSDCSSIFVKQLRDQCLEISSNNTSKFFIDENSNNLLDNYETIASPEIIE